MAALSADSEVPPVAFKTVTAEKTETGFTINIVTKRKNNLN